MTRPRPERQPAACYPRGGPSRQGLRRWCACGLALGLLLGAVWTLPAAWVVPRPDATTPLRVLCVAGTLWRGSAVIALSDGVRPQEALALPGRLSWRVTPYWSAHGPGLTVRIEHDTALPRAARLTLDASGIKLEALRALLPAQWLAGLGAPWNTVRLAGSLHLETEGLRVRRIESRWQPDGVISLTTSQLRSDLSTVAPLGDYRLAVRGDGISPSTLTVQTLAGDLRLSGSGTWLGERLRFRGEGRAAPGREQALSPLLSLIGTYRHGVAKLRID